MKLNPNKYVFSITASKFLGFLVIKQGIDANLEKILMILNMRHPTSKKEVQ